MQAVKAYMEYLRDISRKIAMQADFRDVLFKQSKSNSTYPLGIIFASEQKKYSRYLESVRDSVGKNKSLFYGAGFMVGKHNVQLAAPLLILELDTEFAADHYELYAVLESLSVNYDLLATLATDKGQRTDNDEDIYQSEATKKIGKFINEINRTIDDFRERMRDKIEYVPLLPAQLNDIMTLLLKAVEKIIARSELPFKYLFEKVNSDTTSLDESALEFNRKKGGRRKSPFAEKDLEYYPDAGFYFLHQIPDELSTYVALDELIKKIGEQKLDNHVLEKILSNALSPKKKIKLNKLPLAPDFADDSWDKLPLSLSFNQKNAIKRAWEEEISYIQGPPGTGKSYTITALMLSAVMAKKRILLVSQKKPALDVIAEFFAKYELPPIIKMYHPESRRVLKEELEGIIREAADNEYVISKWQKQKYEGLINEQLKTIRRSQGELRRNLEQEEENYKLNERFQVLKQHFCESYGLPKGHRFAVLKNLEKLEKFIDRLERFIGQDKKNYANSIMLEKAKRDLHKRLNLEFPQGNEAFLIFCRNAYELHRIYKELHQKEQKREFEQHRRDIAHARKVLFETVKKLICLQIKEIDLNIDPFKTALEGFKRMLYYVNTNKIKTIMESIDYHALLQVFPVWVADIRDLNKVFPLQAGMFDLIVVDEASQVNLAEILPVFYRGKRICVVGDHHQLNLKATGLTFSFSKQFDEMSWETYREEIGFDFLKAIERKLTVSSASILDFLRNEENENSVSIPFTLLDEHWRSLPALATFTSNYFYDKKLKIMTDLPANREPICFESYYVKDGKREENSLQIREEAQKAIEIARKHLLRHSTHSLGFIAVTTHQSKLLEELVEREFADGEIEKHSIIAGTPEFFQGHERDAIIISLAVEKTAKRSASHYENAPRVNVATSRAKKFLYLVHSGIPENFRLWNTLLNHFTGEVANPFNNENFKKLTLEKCESEFEKKVALYLIDYVKDKPHLKISNQIDAIGYRLDFAIHNTKNKETAAIEVDGRHHFEGANNYTLEHLKRHEILTRAGWKIINTPYHRWWANGWITYPQKEIARIYSELDEILGNTPV